MSPFSIAALAFSMSADACAAAMARGVATRPNWPSAIKGGMVFGIIETITPLVGWALGLAASRYIAAIDHWVAFVLLTGVVDLARVRGRALHHDLGFFGTALADQLLRLGEIAVRTLHHRGLGLLAEHDLLDPPQRITGLGTVGGGGQTAYHQGDSGCRAGDGTQEP